MKKHLSDEQTAAVAYAANTALREILGEELHRDYRLANEPEDHQAMVAHGVKNARSGVTPEQSHRNWCKDMQTRGWTWGPVEDPILKTHPNLVDYPDLPDEQKIKDRLFLLIVAALTIE